MKVIPFHEGHLTLIEVQDAQQNAPLSISRLGQVFHAITGVHEGVVMGIAVAVELAPHRASLDVLLSKHAKEHMREITQIGLDFIETLPYRRIEATVEAAFEKGHRWMEICGFKRETPEPMKYFGDDMGDYVLYSRIK